VKLITAGRMFQNVLCLSCFSVSSSFVCGRCSSDLWAGTDLRMGHGLWLRAFGAPRNDFSIKTPC